MVIDRPKVEEIHPHSKLIYYCIFLTCIVILMFFSALSYHVYLLTQGTNLVVITALIFSPVVFAIILTLLLVYMGKKKFYRFVKKEEMHFKI